MERIKLKLLLYLCVAIPLVSGLWACKPADSNKLAIPIGVLTDLSSYTSEYGKQELAGIESLMDQFKAKGGQSYRLLTQDTKGSPKDAVSAFNQIISTEKSVPILFSALSSISMAVLPVAEQNNVLTLCNATTPDVLKASTQSIRNFPAPSQEIDTLYNGAILPAGIKSIGILYVNDEYGKSMAALVKERSGKNGSPSQVYSEGYGFDVADFRSLAAKLVASKAESVICVGYGSQVGSAIKQIRENGYKGKIFVPSLIVTTESVLKAAGAALENVVFNGYEYQEGSQELESFKTAFKSHYPSAMSDIGVLAYVGMKIVLENNSKTPAETLKKIEASSPFNTILGKVALVNRSFVYPMKLYIVNNGKLNAYKP